MLKLTLFLLLTSILGQALVASRSHFVGANDYEDCFDELTDCENNVLKYPNFCSQYEDKCKKSCGLCGDDNIVPRKFTLKEILCFNINTLIHSGRLTHLLLDES